MTKSLSSNVTVQVPFLSQFILTVCNLKTKKSLIPKQSENNCSDQSTQPDTVLVFLSICQTMPHQLYEQQHCYSSLQGIIILSNFPFLMHHHSCNIFAVSYCLIFVYWNYLQCPQSAQRCYACTRHLLICHVLNEQ